MTATAPTTLPDFSQTRILIVGDIMLDRYWTGDTNRISPEAPVPVVKVKDHEDRPGGAANVALNLAKLGCQTQLLGYTGDDDTAKQLQDLLQQQNVQTHFIQQQGKPTITKLRVMSRSQQLMRLDFEQSFDEQYQEQLDKQFQTLLDDIDIVVLSDYKKGTLNQAAKLIQLAKSKQRPVVVDPKSENLGDYREASIITPNLKEFAAAAGTWQSEQELIDKARQEIQEHQLDNLLLTRSEQGMTLIQANQAPINLPTKAQEVFDVTGAGDTVVAVLAAAWASNMPLEQAVSLANTAAGIVVGKLGTASVTPNELEQALNHCNPIQKSILDEDQLLTEIQKAQANGETVVMTNGCFDLLHAGHVSYLAEARQLGDRLIVAVNTDDSVRRLKGETRPINAVENRMTVLAALGSVDWVTSFSEDTPERLICKLKPNILVKGGDNDPQKIPGNHCVWDNGGDVIVLSFKDGISTTRTIAKIQHMPKENKDS